MVENSFFVEDIGNNTNNFKGFLNNIFVFNDFLIWFAEGNRQFKL